MIKSKFKPAVIAKIQAPVVSKEIIAAADKAAKHATEVDEKTEHEALFESLGKQAKASVAKTHKELFDKQATNILVDDVKEPSTEEQRHKVVSFVTQPMPYREPRWLTSSDVAKHLHVSIRRLAKYRMDKEGPRYYQLKDGLTLYNVHDVDTWVMQHGSKDAEISL